MQDADCISGKFDTEIFSLTTPQLTYGALGYRPHTPPKKNHTDTHTLISENQPRLSLIYGKVQCYKSMKQCLASSEEKKSMT